MNRVVRWTLMLSALGLALGSCSKEEDAATVATCYDGIQNQGETGIDCGGPCAPCVTVPVVTTASVTSITQTTATGGGTVSSDGGSPVTARGVCWGTATDPTISDAHTSDGTDTGSFVSDITGLALGTQYYVRAYATNSKGTAYGNERTFTTSTTLSIGQQHAGGIIFTLDSTATHGMVCATADMPVSSVWGCDNINVPGASGLAIGTGLQNTMDIINGCSNGAAAQSCWGATMSGYSDWFLPSRDELITMYWSLKVKGIGNFSPVAYWSSSEESATMAYMVLFYNGQYQVGVKTAVNAVRAVRNF